MTRPQARICQYMLAIDVKIIQQGRMETEKWEVFSEDSRFKHDFLRFRIASRAMEIEDVITFEPNFKRLLEISTTYPVRSFFQRDDNLIELLKTMLPGLSQDQSQGKMESHIDVEQEGKGRKDDEDTRCDLSKKIFKIIRDEFKQEEYPKKEQIFKEIEEAFLKGTLERLERPVSLLPLFGETFDDICGGNIAYLKERLKDVNLKPQFGEEKILSLVKEIAWGGLTGEKHGSAQKVPPMEENASPIAPICEDEVPILENSKENAVTCADGPVIATGMGIREEGDGKEGQDEIVSISQKAKRGIEEICSKTKCREKPPESALRGQERETVSVPKRISERILLSSDVGEEKNVDYGFTFTSGHALLEELLSAFSEDYKDAEPLGFTLPTCSNIGLYLSKGIDEIMVRNALRRSHGYQCDIAIGKLQEKLKGFSKSVFLVVRSISMPTNFSQEQMAIIKTLDSELIQGLADACDSLKDEFAFDPIGTCFLVDRADNSSNSDGEKVVSCAHLFNTNIGHPHSHSRHRVLKEFESLSHGDCRLLMLHEDNRLKTDGEGYKSKAIRDLPMTLCVGNLVNGELIEAVKLFELPRSTLSYYVVEKTNMDRFRGLQAVAQATHVSKFGHVITDIHFAGKNADVVVCSVGGDKRISKDSPFQLNDLGLKRNELERNLERSGALFGHPGSFAVKDTELFLRHFPDILYILVLVVYCNLRKKFFLSELSVDEFETFSEFRSILKEPNNRELIELCSAAIEEANRESRDEDTRGTTNDARMKLQGILERPNGKSSVVPNIHTTISAMILENPIVIRSEDVLPEMCFSPFHFQTTTGWSQKMEDTYAILKNIDVIPSIKFKPLESLREGKLAVPKIMRFIKSYQDECRVKEGFQQVQEQWSHESPATAGCSGGPVCTITDDLELQCVGVHIGVIKVDGPFGTLRNWFVPFSHKEIRELMNRSNVKVVEPKSDDEEEDDDEDRTVVCSLL